MSWRPVKAAPKPAMAMDTKIIVFAALVAVNLGVFAYHGDPRDKLPESVKKAREGSSNIAHAKMTDRAIKAQQARKAAHKQSSLASPEVQADVHSNAQADTQKVESPEVKEVPTKLADAGSTIWHVDEFVGPPFDPAFGLRTPGVIQRVEEVKLKSGQTAAAAISALGVKNEEITRVISSLQELVDFRRLRPGYIFKARFDGLDELISLDVISSKINQVRTEKKDSQYVAHQLNIEVDTLLVPIHGVVNSSLWGAVTSAGESPSLVMAIAGIFEWEIDFYTEVYAGDTFRILVEKRYAEGEFLGYGRVLGAEFVSNGTPHQAFIVDAKAEVSAYYDEMGQSMRKKLLKTPLQYGRVTSGFGRRRHPVLGYTRAHQGIDYGTPVGTPVWAVGEGKVIRAFRNGGYGNYVEVRHANGWRSEYAHLSKIKVRVGEHVSQKQVIALSGNTGISTGPHLHYGLKKHGTFVNPARQSFDRGKSLTGSAKETFLKNAEEYLRKMDEHPVASETARRTVQEG
ncbi:M23 family metallopeptidase [Myxococcota bacterium]|nr:M23 family metallopeptidase [Myxococcota bacterium]